MKRSEMVGIMQEEIEDYLDDMISSTLAERLLNKIEKAGMLPPSRPTGEFTGHISSMKTNTWEPETVSEQDNCCRGGCHE